MGGGGLYDKRTDEFSVVIIPVACRPVFYQGAVHRVDALRLLVEVDDVEMCQMLQLETESSGSEEHLQFQTQDMNHPQLQKITSFDNDVINLIVSLVCDLW